MHPIDALVQAQLSTHALQLSPVADRRTLARRLSFDLIGLPPSPQEVEQFVSDTFQPGIRTVRRPTALESALRRANGAGLVGRCSICRHSRLPQRQSSQHLALSRLGDRKVSTRTNRSTASRLNRSRAIYCPMRTKKLESARHSIACSFQPRKAVPSPGLRSPHADRSRTGDRHRVAWTDDRLRAVVMITSLIRSRPATFMRSEHSLLISMNRLWVDAKMA